MASTACRAQRGRRCESEEPAQVAGAAEGPRPRCFGLGTLDTKAVVRPAALHSNCWSHSECRQQRRAGKIRPMEGLRLLLQAEREMEKQSFGCSDSSRGWLRRGRGVVPLLAQVQGRSSTSVRLGVSSAPSACPLLVAVDGTLGMQQSGRPLLVSQAHSPRNAVWATQLLLKRINQPWLRRNKTNDLRITVSVSYYQAH